MYIPGNPDVICFSVICRLTSNDLIFRDTFPTAHSFSVVAEKSRQQSVLRLGQSWHKDTQIARQFHRMLKKIEKNRKFVSTSRALT